MLKMPTYAMPPNAKTLPRAPEVGPTAFPHSATLDDFVRRLQILQALGAGSCPVLIETRNRWGEVIYARANARRDSVRREAGGFRRLGSPGDEEVPVVRIG